MFVLGMILLALVATAGLALVRAGRAIDNADDPHDADLGPVSGFVDGNLRRTRTAVDTLIQPDATLAEVRPTRYALGERATTYSVFGVGLVGIVAFVAIGFTLLDL
jgi:hypothetical protein